MRFPASFVMALTVELAPCVEQRLEALARRTGVAQAELVRELISRGLDDLEDFFLAAATMERVTMGEETVFLATQVRAQLERE